MFVYIGTIVRGASLPEGGELVKLDWATGQAVAKAPMLPTHPRITYDPNPRGNTRGYRGIIIEGDEVVAANYHTLQVFDRSLNHKRSLSHGLMVDLHDSFAPGDGTVWVTSTAIDGALRYRLADGALRESFWPREMPVFQETLGLAPQALDLAADQRLRYLKTAFRGLPSHTHLNAVAAQGGTYYGLFNRLGVVANLSAPRVMVEDAALRGAHNLLVLDDGRVLTLDTHRAHLRCYDLASGRPLWARNFRHYPWVRDFIRRHDLAYGASELLGRLRLRPKKAVGRPLFLRGMALHGGRLYIGMTPAAVACVEAADGTFVEARVYARDLNVTVHGLCVSGR